MNVFLIFDSGFMLTDLKNSDKEIIDYLKTRNATILNEDLIQSDNQYEDSLALIKAADLLIMIVNQYTFIQGYYLSYALKSQKKALLFSQKNNQAVEKITSPFLYYYSYRSNEEIKNKLSLFQL